MNDSPSPRPGQLVAAVWRDVARVRDASPLVHSITNFVVMNSTANALLAIGASPVMAHAPEEVEEMAGLAGALVLNIGTLSRDWVEAMLLAAGAAGRRGVPVVLDPVGAGATRLRTETARMLLREARPAIVRGNASEIMAMAGEQGGARGVDARHGTAAAMEAACALGREHGCVVVVSGAVDLVVGQGLTYRIANGHPLMPRVTGLGCTCTALIGAFAAVADSPVEAAAHAMAVTGIAGELAGEGAAGPGSLQVRLLDALHGLGEDQVRQRLRLERAA